MKPQSKLALGTAQFGSAYGVSNLTGQVPLDEIRRILESAWEGGIDTLDTAISYGESEARLGEAGVHPWKIITKLPALPEGKIPADTWVGDQVSGSLKRLQVERLGALLLHRPLQLLDPAGPELFHALQTEKHNGRVDRIGFSIYDPEELDALWEHYRPDLVQAPLNIFDQRLVNSGWMERLHRAGVEVHIRSVFLQGLLLIPADERPGRFHRWSPIWREYDAFLDVHHLTPAEACLGYALQVAHVSRIVLGVQNRHHLQDLVRITTELCPLESGAFAQLAQLDRNLLHPGRWPAE